jgi:hypothetical protein
LLDLVRDLDLLADGPPDVGVELIPPDASRLLGGRSIFLGSLPERLQRT